MQPVPEADVKLEPVEVIGEPTEQPWLAFSLRRTAGGYEMRVGNVPHGVMEANTLPGHDYQADALGLQTSKIERLLEQYSWKGTL